MAAAGGASAASGVFADLIGCQSVLAKIKEWQATITASQKMGMDPLESFELNFLFVGSPGACVLCVDVLFERVHVCAARVEAVEGVQPANCACRCSRQASSWRP